MLVIEGRSQRDQHDTRVGPAQLQYKRIVDSLALFTEKSMELCLRWPGYTGSNVYLEGDD